ncbi:MAG: response regulator SirA, partial [Bacteroidetes bacterium]|nr:response regulator SirA [Bacteroidota bacterium]
GILRVDHPDIEEFINCKNDVTQITNFNISVAITSEFMDAVRDDKDFNLIDPRTKRITKTIKAKELFSEITTQAHATGEPGLFFIDEANKHNSVPHLGTYEACNPCFELPLLPYDICNLMSINVYKYAIEIDEVWVVDWPTLETDIYTAVRFIDNVIDQNDYPIHQIKELSIKIRRVGLGIMGWADLLIKLKMNAELHYEMHTLAAKHCHKCYIILKS